MAYELLQAESKPQSAGTGYEVIEAETKSTPLTDFGRQITGYVPPKTSEEKAARSFYGGATEEPGQSLHSAIQDAIGKQVKAAQLSPEEIKALAENTILKWTPGGMLARQFPKAASIVEKSVADIAGGLKNPENLLFAPLGLEEAQFLAKPVLAGFTALGAGQTVKGIINKDPEAIITGAAFTALPAAGLLAKTARVAPATANEVAKTVSGSTLKTPIGAKAPKPEVLGPEEPLKPTPITSGLPASSELPESAVFSQSILDKAGFPNSIEHLKRIFPRLNMSEDSWAQLFEESRINARKKVSSQVDIQNTVPAIETMSGELKPADKGTSHNEAIEKHGLSTEDINKRTYMDTRTGEEVPPEVLAEAGLPTAAQKGQKNKVNRVHSDALAEAQGLKTPASKIPLTVSKEGGFEKFDYSPEDLAKYKKISAEWDKFRAQNDTPDKLQANESEYKRIFSAFEQIRNKYGGMPPKNLKAVKTVKEPEPAAGKVATTEQQPAAVSASPTIKNPMSAFGKKFYKNTEGQWRQKGKPSERVNQSTIDALEQLIGKKPELVGMGGAIKSEFTDMAGQDVTGVRQVTREKMADAGVPTIAERGVGRNLEQALSHGRELLAKDPNHANKAMDEFRKSGRFSEDDFDAVRAMLDETRRSGRRIEEKFGTNSPEYLNAVDNTLMWDKLAKDMQTQWGRIGVGQQGELDVDTGSVLGLETEYKKATDKNFTPAQRKTAGQMVEKIKVAKAESSKAIYKYTTQMDLGLKDIDVPAPKDAAEARQLFAKYASGSKMTPQQIKTIWNWAKQGYLEKGVTKFGEIKHGVANDLGIKPEDVAYALAQPKNARALSADAYRKMAQSRALTNAAKQWVNAQKYPKWAKWLMSYPRLRFSMAVFGHGFVPFGTHAPIEFFQPWHYPRLVSDYIKMSKMVVNAGYHEMVMQDLEHSPRYWFWRQNGAQIDITRPMEEYAEPGLITKLQTGGRGFDILKVLRYQKNEHAWNNLPKSMQTKDMAKLIADMSNHSTGVVKMFPIQGKAGRIAQFAMFAPRLVASRFAWTIGDPMKATGILIRKGLGGGKGVTPEEMTFARKVYGERAAVAAVYYGYLLLNQEYLNATDSNQKVNFTDFHRSDWLAFKLGGREIRPWSPEITLLRDAMKILQAGVMPQSKWQQLTGGRGSAFSDAALGYARGTLSPAAQDIPDFYTRQTMTGQYLPTEDYSDIPLRDRRRGLEPMTWAEYGIQKAAPIPAQEVSVPAYHIIRDAFKQQGISKEDTEKFIKGLADSVAMGLTGIRVQPDIYEQQTTE